MYNTRSIVIFYFAWALESDDWGILMDVGIIKTLYKGNFAVDSLTVNKILLSDDMFDDLCVAVSEYGIVDFDYWLIFLYLLLIWSFNLLFLVSD